MRGRTLLAIALLLTTGPRSLGQIAAKRLNWPTVATQQRSYSFQDAVKAKLSMTIKSGAGSPLYLLRCANTDLSEGEAMHGDFACWLNVIDPSQRSRFVRGLNLLSPTPFNGSRLNDSGGGIEERESVWAWQLAGNCGDYPDFGRERVFRLRGMKLTLKFRNIQFSSKEGVVDLEGFDLSVTVRQDENAISSIAMPSLFAGFGEPEADLRGCDSVKPNTKKQMPVKGPYPAVRPTEFNFNFPVRNFAPDSPTANWRRSILAEDGSIAYEFSCEGDSGTPEHSAPSVLLGARYAKEGIGIVNAGIWCRLAALGMKGPNLLDLTPDPYSRTSRAEIFPDQLRGACADYPEWGRQRSFRLRGMKLTMVMDETKFEGSEIDLEGLPAPDLVGMRIHVAVAPDSSAATPVPEQVRYADWSLVPTTCKIPVLNPLASEALIFTPTRKTD